MSRIISFVAHKGGAGKTTCAQQVAAALAQLHHFQVLVIDLDTQSNLTKGLTREAIPINLTASQMLLDESSRITDYIINIRPNLDLIPNRYVPEQDQELAPLAGRWRNLKDRLQTGISYDYIIIDTPPALHYQTRTAIITADLVVLVMSCSHYSLIGATNLVGQVMDLEEQSHRGNIPIKVLINLYDERRGLDQRLRAEIERIFEADVYRTVIRQNVRLGDAAQVSQTIFEKDHHSAGAQDFEKLTKELIAKMEAASLINQIQQEESRAAWPRRHATVVIPINAMWNSKIS